MSKVQIDEKRLSPHKKFKITDFMKRDTNITRLLIMLLAVFIIMTILKPEAFLRKDNFVSMAYQFPEYGIMSIAMMLAMITGGIDLSIVGVADLAGIVCAYMLAKAVPQGASSSATIGMIVLGIVIALVIGALCGLFNGLIISKIGIVPMLATLGSMQLFTGIALVITKGKIVTGIPMMFSEVGNTAIGGFLPVPLLIFIICAVFVAVLLSKTSFGIKLYMIGTNPTAATFSGLKKDKMIILSYMCSGILAAAAGLIMVARTNSAKADFGASYTLQTVLISVLGGVNPNGGFGTVGGVTIAILILQFLSSGFNMFPFISNFFRDLIWGVVLIVVMIINYYSNKKAEKKGA